MRYLVAGGAGFVGSHVCRRLRADGDDVICVDNFVTGSLDNIRDLEGPGFELVEGDVEQTPFREVDVVLHLASPASPVDYERLPLETLSANSAGTKRLLEVATGAGARLVFVSTSEVYGDPLIHPQPESYWGNVDPIGPRACYDEGKRFGEALLTSWRSVHHVNAAIVRVFNTYGPNMRLDDGRVVPELLGAVLAGRPLVLHGGGNQTRSFMYVSDLVDGLLRVARDRDADGDVLNIGNPDEVTISELAHRIGTVSGQPIEIVSVPARPGDPQRRRPDIGRMNRRYGWHPVVGLDEGLGRTIDWFSTQQHRRVPAGASLV